MPEQRVRGLLIAAGALFVLFIAACCVTFTVGVTSTTFIPWAAPGGESLTVPHFNPGVAIPGFGVAVVAGILAGGCFVAALRRRGLTWDDETPSDD
ncbi:hypothetical protein [Curtobacterium sp. MCBD17_026]|uniref:hypothetical protein n=1 Tax=Curtobacterium sp. MCBD17_026 TaxID=2175621 RepID=UPI000DA7F7DA|nr:hypothetical protein [Curtobacterium sp. MCBD17_026]WIB72589.1 hypothetical protein DEI85_17515 [Curtobacterium sp. MCBD17_026]